MNHFALYALTLTIIAFTLLNPTKIVNGVKQAHNWLIGAPTLYLISCGGLVLLVSWWIWIISGGTF